MILLDISLQYSVNLLVGISAGKLGRMNTCQGGTGPTENLNDSNEYDLDTSVVSTQS